MGEVLNQMLENYLVSSNVQLQKGPDSLSFTINLAEGIFFFGGMVAAD